MVGEETLVAAPQGNFRPAVLPIRSAALDGGSSPSESGSRVCEGAAPRFGAGKKFEAKVLAGLRDVLPAGGQFFPAPWIRFTDASGPTARRCQPDGLWYWQDALFVFEIKTLHTIQAWHQLRRLYAPVAEMLSGRKLQIVLCEIVQKFEPIGWPEPLEFCLDLDDVLRVASITRPPMLVWRWK